MALSIEEQREFLGPHIPVIDFVNIGLSEYICYIEEITPWVDKKIEIYQNRVIQYDMVSGALIESLSIHDRRSLEKIQENLDWVVQKYFGERSKED